MKKILFLPKTRVYMHNNTSHTTSDEILFYQIQQGNEDAFEALFLRHYPALCAYARLFVEPEIVSDVMVWLWENKEMQAFETSLKSYLFKAVKNRCLTLINRNEVKQRIEKMIFDNLQSQYDDPDFYVMQELTEKIEEALARLPENIREAFELNRFQNLTYNEIAERLGVSPKTIDYRIQQALKQLRIDLKDYLPVLLSFLLR